MDYELVRTLLLEVLRQMLDQLRNGQTNEAQYGADMQFRRFEALVQRLAMQRSIASSGNAGWSRQEKQYLAQALWELIIQGVLIPGTPGIETNGWPSVSLTEHGKKVIFQELYTPYDPEGYLTQLKADIPSIDETAMFYIEEALGSFRANRYVPATVMLGVASERLFDLLLESFARALPEAQGNKLSRETEGSSIARRYEELKKRLDSKRGQLPKDLELNLDTALISVFNIIKAFRDDIGHPTGRRIERSEAYASLYVFASYCKQMYALIDFFEANPGLLTRAQ